MPRKPEPSFRVKEIIWDLAATAGTKNLSALYKDLDYKLERLRQSEDEGFFEDTPDIRTIQRIIEVDINRLVPEVVITKLPSHVWHLRHDYEDIKQLAKGSIEAKPETLGKGGLGEDKQREQISQVLVTDDRHRALMLHSEAIKKAINTWVEKLRPPSDEELRDAWKGKLNGWGVITEVTADGHGSAAPTMGKHPLYDSLRHHLVPPVVEEGFWEKSSQVVDLALSFQSGATAIYSELSKAAEQRSGFGIITESWQAEPVTGLTTDFIQTLYEHALGITDFGSWTHSAWAALWPTTGGLIVTWPNEGVRLLQHFGLDPFIQETYWPLAGGPFMLPRHSKERIAYGDASLVSPCRVAFLLCFGTKVIATAFLLEQLTPPEEAHRAIMADCASWQKAGSLMRTRKGLDSLSHELQNALESAACETSFPGRCARCP